MNPYLAGIGLGLVLLAAFVLVGRGLGASGAFNSTIAWLVSLVAPAYARQNEFLSGYLTGDTHPLKAWLVFEVIGVFAGALLSGLLAGRVGGHGREGPARVGRHAARSRVRRRRAHGRRRRARRAAARAARRSRAARSSTRGAGPS